VRYLPVIFIALAFVAIQALIGGVKMVFSLPAYLLLAVGAIAAMAISRKQVRPPIVCGLTALGLAAWVTVRALLSPIPYLARTDLLMVLAALSLYLVTVMDFREMRTRFILLGVLLALALAQAIIGAMQFKQLDDFMLLPGIMRPPYGWRASGFYICPNHLAGLLEMCGLLSLGLAFWGNFRPRWRVLAAFGTLVWFGAVGITGSRGGYLSVVFGLGVFAVLSLWVVWLLQRGGFFAMMAGLLLFAGLIVGGGFLFMSQSDNLRERMAQIYDPTNMRLLMWKGAVQQYHLQPVIGTGSGTTFYLARQFRSREVQNDPQHDHDDYLELLAEYGIVGAVLFGLFLLVHLWSGLVGIRRIVAGQIFPGTPPLSHDLAITVGALSAIGALLFHSLLDFNMHIPGNALLVAFLFGLLAMPVSRENLPETAEPERPAGIWRWLTLIVAICLLLLSARFWPGEIFAEKARVALRDNRNAEALALAKHGLAWEKHNPWLYGYLGEATHFLTLTAPDTATGQVLEENAAAAYADALKIFPYDTGLLLKQAQIFDLLGRFPEAEQNFQQMFRYDPLFGNIYAYYGLHWELQRRIKTAERCFRVADQLGEHEISRPELEKIARARNNPLTGTLLDVFPDVMGELPAERVLPKP
jgi:O-antigen ligase